MLLSNPYKIVKFTTSIVCTTMLLLIFAHLAPSKAQEVFSFEFNDTLTDDKTVAVYKGDTTLNDVHSTIKHSFPTITITGSIWIGNSLKFIQSHLNLSNTSKTITSDWGTWHVNISNSICEENYYCSTVRFVPNVSKINSEAFGATISTILAARILSTFERKAVNLDFKREDVRISWRDHESNIKEGLISPNGGDTHIFNIETYINNNSELSFELWSKEGSNSVRKQALTRGTYTDTVAFAAWYIEFTYGTWVVSESNTCSTATDGKNCLRGYYITNTEGANLRGKNVSMELRATKTIGNIKETQSVFFRISGSPEATLTWNNEGDEQIEAGSKFEFDNVVGTGEIFKEKVNSLTTEATERITQGTQFLFANESMVALEIKDDISTDLDMNLRLGSWSIQSTGTNTRVDPINNLFQSGRLQFTFKPNSAAINRIISKGDTAISSIKFNIHETDSSSSIVHSMNITVTITRPTDKALISIASNTTTVSEGMVAVFTVSTFQDPGYPLQVSYTPTNSQGDFLNAATFLPGHSKIATLTFDQAEGSEDWTDEIHVDLRDIDGKDADDGSITVSLDPVLDNAAYLVAEAPNNSATIMVIDFESPSLDFSEDTITVTESDINKNIQLTLNLSEAIADSVSISYTIVEETATAGLDFVDITNGNVSILQNTTSIPITVQIEGDDLSEGDETFKIIVSTRPNNAYFYRGTNELEATVTIYDDEPILLSAATTNFNVPEDVVDGNFVIDLQLTSAVAYTNSVTTSVSYETTVSSGTATMGEDFMSPVINRRTININSITDSQLIPILNDIDNEGNETFSVTISNLTGANFASGGTKLTLDITIIDNENPELSLAEDSYSITEEDTDTNIELTFNLSGPIENPIEISYETIDDTATPDVDFTNISNGTATITPNTTSVSISIEIKGDTLNEGNETFMVKVATPPTYAVFADENSELVATITIIDDEVPTLSVDNSTLSVSESAGTTKIGLILSGPTSDDVVVTYSTSITDLNTAQPADFTAQSASTQTITSDASSRLIQIPINNDTDTEEEETFTLMLSQVTGAAFLGGTNITVIVTIVDDERLPTLSINSTRVNVNEQAGYAEIGLSFTPATTEPVIVTYTTIQNTAFDGMDYVLQTSEIIEIPSGPSGTIYIPITNDNIYEGNENFSVVITGISGAAYESDVINEPIIVTIVDNEVEPTLTISSLTCGYGEPITTGVTVGESDENLILNAKLSHPSKNPVSFKFASSIDLSLSPFATSDDFYVNDARQVTIQPGSICTEVITPITYDELGEEDEKFWVEFTDNSDMEIIPRILVTIVDDDVVIWSIDDLAMDEGDVNTGMFFNVSLNTSRPFDLGTINADWTVTSESGNTATFREDYAPRHNLHTGKVYIFGGRTQSLIGEHDPMNRIETVGDTIYEPDETFTVTLSNPTGDS